MPIVQMKLVSTHAPLSTHGRLFREEENDGKKTLRLVKPDIRLTIANPCEVDLPSGQYHYIFSAQNGICDFKIVTSKKSSDGYFQIDVDTFQPTTPYETFEIVSSFTVTA